ncbi:GLPGLI family protein [Chryseobacterium turcicum]|uniref:GLPGLI family protein n=1 Tax=Chryseobacterium turcicum TaxID=2898076 RepID=A0A9Q3YWL9_9FLAO|nr:GLPGLI family protein [Chryseobacterium turcicum]MCD1118691.1 GLPGLI family protein [Chryseobacterium turcicum]
MKITFQKTTLLFALFISFLAFSQTNRFIYEFKYKKDSLATTYDEGNMVLDITGKKVQFYDFNAIKTDSTNRNSAGYTTYSFPFAKLQRNISSGDNINYNLVAESYFAYNSSDKFNWIISKDTKTKNKWKLQKATTQFGGRTWEAWFTTDLPFSEGPYKFNGLPGLIVELKDSKNNFIFDLVKVENPQDANPKLVETVFKSKPIIITFEKYNILLINYYNDPFSRFRSMKPGTWSIGRADETFIEDLEGLNKITKEEQEEIRKNNNPIELDKAIKYSKK